MRGEPADLAVLLVEPRKQPRGATAVGVIGNAELVRSNASSARIRARIGRTVSAARMTPTPERKRAPIQVH